MPESNAVHPNTAYILEQQKDLETPKGYSFGLQSCCKEVTLESVGYTLQVKHTGYSSCHMRSPSKWILAERLKKVLQ